jgi:methylenetetrahydrofolate--tRNA-(uracil-5-)-methyltransferase
MAERGPETLRHGPMKPMGLTNAHQPDVKPYAVVQLRQDNALGTLYNLVGFQTKMKYGAQADVIRMIPGLEQAEFARLGGIHRNTFINSPKLLDAGLRLKQRPCVRFAGQITGVEGYVESAAMGLMAGRMAAAELMGTRPARPAGNHCARRTDLAHHRWSSGRRDRRCHLQGALVPADEREFRAVSGGGSAARRKRQAPRGKAKKPARQLAYTTRAKQDFAAWLSGNAMPAAAE